MSGKVIDQEGNEQIYLAHYWRYYVEYRAEFDNPDDAMNMLHYSSEEGELAACCVMDPDGYSRTVEVEYGEKQPDGTWAPDRVFLSEIVNCPSERKTKTSWTSGAVSTSSTSPTPTSVGITALVSSPTVR